MFVIASTTDVVLQNELNNSLAPGQAVIRNADGTIAQIFLPFVNSGNTQTNGIDFGLQYVYPTKVWNLHLGDQRDLGEHLPAGGLCGSAATGIERIHHRPHLRRMMAT